MRPNFVVTYKLVLLQEDVEYFGEDRDLRGFCISLEIFGVENPGSRVQIS